MEAETTVSGFEHQKENRKDLICEDSAVDKFHGTLLELRSSVTKQNPDEKMEMVNVTKNTETISNLEDVKVETSEKFMEAQSIMSTEVQTGEKKHFEGEEFCETPFETRVVSVISSDEYEPAETLDLNLEETNEQETYSSTLATRQTPRMQIQIQKDQKEYGAETSEISADEFPQNVQAQSGDLSGLLIKEKSAARGLFATAEDDNLMKSSEQSESEIRKNEDQKEAERENISSMSFQNNSTIAMNLPDSLRKGEESKFFELVEAVHEIGQTNSEDENPKDMGLSLPAKIVEAIPVAEQHFCKEISSISENPTPEKHDNRENMDSGDSTFLNNPMLVQQKKCELDEANKEAVLMFDEQRPEDTTSVADEWICNATKELKEEQFVETTEDGLNEKKSTGTEYKKICESLSEEGNVEPINQSNTITKEIQLNKETMEEKLKNPFYAENKQEIYAENKQERSSLNAEEGEFSEESHYLSSEPSGCKDINDLENVTDGKSLFPSNRAVNKESFKSEEVCEAHTPSMISSTKNLPLKGDQIQETGAEICDSEAQQLKEVIQKLDKEADDLYLQQPSADLDQKTSIRGGGREKASETEYVKLETTSESIGSLPTEGNNMKIIEVIDKGNLDASMFSHEELLSQNQHIVKCVNRVQNDDSEEVTEILMPETIGPRNIAGLKIEKERANNDLDVKCVCDTLRHNTEQQQAIFVEKTEKTIFSALKDYKDEADDMSEKEVLTDDGTSQQAIGEQNLQKDEIACKFVPTESVPQITAESSGKDSLPTKGEAVENVTDDNEKDGELLKGIQDLNAEQALELISLSDEKLQKDLQFSDTEALSSTVNVGDDVNEEITITSSTIEASTGEMVDKAKVEEVDEHFVLVSNEKALEKIPSPTSADMKEEVVEENERQRSNQYVSYATPSKEGTISQQEVENEKLDDGPPQEATEKQNQTITDGYICKDICLQNEDENVTVSQASIEEGFHEVERFDCSPDSQAPIGNNLLEDKTSSEVHEEISSSMPEKNDLETTTNKLDTESVQGTIEGCAKQKEITFAEEPVETTSSTLKEYGPEADYMENNEALREQGTSAQAIDEESLKKDGTNFQEVPYEIVSQDANESSELVSLTAQKEIDGNLIQYDEKNGESLERSQNLDAELALERTCLPDTCLEKNHQPLETEPLSKYITSDHKADNESTITSSSLQASIGKKVDKVKQEEFDETVMLVSEEKAPETIPGLASESVKDAIVESNEKQESNQYASYITPSKEEASSQQGKTEIKFHDVPKAATEDQTSATTDEQYRCKERSFQNEDENITAHQDFLTEISLQGQNINSYPVSQSHASADNNLQKDETSCQMHERMSNFMSDERNLENADHDKAAADEATGGQGDTDHKNHGHIKQADETSTPEVENEYKIIKEETFNAVPEDQDTESGSLYYSKIRESLDQKDIPDESSHRDYIETVIKNNESSTSESNHTDNLNKEEIINEILLEQSIPKLQSLQDLNIVKEIIKGATELVPEGQDHESGNDNYNIVPENDAVKCKNANELDILDETVHFEPVVHVKSEQNLNVVEDNSIQSLVSSEPLPIEKNLENEIEACEIRPTSDTMQCESPKESDIKVMTCHDQSVFQVKTGEDMHLIYEHNGTPKDDSGTVYKEERSESCVKMTDIKTSNLQSSVDKHKEKDSLEDELASETDSSALHAAQITDQRGEDSENVHKSNLEEQQVNSIITGNCAEELAVLVTGPEAHSSFHEDKRVDEELNSTSEEELHDSRGQQKEMNRNTWDISVTGGQTPSHVDIAEGCEPQGDSEPVSEDRQQETNTKATEIQTLRDGSMEEKKIESSTITLQPVEGLVQTENEEKVEEDRTTNSKEHAQEHINKKESIEGDAYQYEQGTGLSFVPATGEHEANLAMKEEELVATVGKRERELLEDEENTNKNLEQLSKDKASIAHILQNKNSEKPINVETTGLSVQISQETMEKLTKSSPLDLEDKNPEKMSSIQDIPLVESKKEVNSLLEMMQTEATADLVKNDGTDSRIHCPTMEKLVEDTELEFVEIPEDTNSDVQDILQVEVDKQEDSTEEILQTKDSKNLEKDMEDISSSTHDSVGKVLQEDMKLENWSIQEPEKEIPKETTTLEDKSEVEVQKKQDLVVELTHRESIKTQIEQVSKNRIQDSNEKTSREHVGKLEETCGLMLQKGTLEQAASLIDIPQVEARMQDDSFEVQEERTKVLIKDDMDISSTNREALRVVSREHVNNPIDSSHLELQMEIPTGAVRNLQALGGSGHEYASQNNESSKDLEVIQDSVQESMQEEIENPDHSHWEIQKVTLEEPTTAEETQCLEDEKQEYAAAEALKDESTQNLVKETTDHCSFSATIASADNNIQQGKENPSKPSNLKLQEGTPEEKPSVEESSQMEIENEKDLTKEKLQKGENCRATSDSREMVGDTLQEHPILLEEAPNKEPRVPPIQDSLQMEEQEEEFSTPNMKVHGDLEHDNCKHEELQSCFKAEMEEGSIHGEKTEMDHDKHVKSPELESEEETPEIIKNSRNTEIEDQPGGEIRLSLIQSSTDASIKTEETERETQGEVLKADPLGQSHQTTMNDENHNKEILKERFTPENAQEVQNEKSEKEFKGPAADKVELGTLSSDKLEEEKTNNFSFLVSGELADEILEASENREIKTMDTNYKSVEMAGQDSSVVLLEDEKQIEEPLSSTNDKISTTVHSSDVFLNQAKFKTASLDKTEDEKLGKTILVHEEQNKEILETSNNSKNETVNSTYENILARDSGVEISSEDKKIEATYQIEHKDQNQETVKVNRKSHGGFKEDANLEPSKQETTVSLRASEFKMEDQQLYVPISVRDEKIQEPKSLELDDEDRTSDTTRSSRNTEKKAQREAENNLFTAQSSFDAGLKVDQSTTQVQQKVLKADPVEKSLAPIDDNESHDKNTLIREFTSKSMEGKSTQHDTSKREESEGTALGQVKLEISLCEKIDTMSILVSEKPKGESPEASFEGPGPNQDQLEKQNEQIEDERARGKLEANLDPETAFKEAQLGKLQLESNKIEMEDQREHAAEETMEAQLEQLDSEINKGELQLQGGSQAESVMDARVHSEITEEDMSKEDSKKHDYAPNSMSNEQIHVLTDTKEHKISKDNQMAALSSTTHEEEEEEKVQDSENKVQNNLECADLTEYETQNASGTRKIIDIGCQNEKNPSYTKVMPMIQASIKERPAGICSLVSEEGINELIGANDDTHINSNITKDKECTDLQEKEVEIYIQGLKEDRTESQMPMILPEVAIDKQILDGDGPSFTKETMKEKDGENNVERNLNIKKLTDSSSEEKTAGPSLGTEEQDRERSKVNNHIELMTMKDEENDNLSFSSETATESRICTDKNKEAVREVSLPVNEQQTRERIEVSKKIEIQVFQNDESWHISTTQLAAKQVIQVESEKMLEITNLVTKLQHHEKDKTNLEYNTPIDDESQNLSSKIQAMTQRSSQDEEAKVAKILDANLAAEIKILESSHEESLASTVSEEEKRSDENLFSFSDMHASADRGNLKCTKDEVPPIPLPEPEIASCRSIYESEHMKTCVQDEMDLQEEAVVSTGKEKKDGEEFDGHPEVLTKYVEMVDEKQELHSRTEIAAETQYKQPDDQPAGEEKMSSQKVNESREGKLQTQADQACVETIEGRKVTDSSSKDIILQKEENEVDQQGIVQEVVEKIEEKEDASRDKKPEEIGRTITRETKAAQKDIKIVDNVSEQKQTMDLGKTSGEEKMKMEEHFTKGKQCAVDDSSDDKPTLCTGLVRSDKSAEEGEEEEHKHEESGFETPVEEVSLEMKSMADVKDDSPHYKTDTVQTDSVHPEKNAEGPDEEESKQEESGSVAPVLEESSGATDRKPAHKKHNILSSVGSKVKHSIGKVKKAITGKSSLHKPHSAKE